jgi:glutamate transport system permease protein
MTAPVLADALGPRARRRVAVATALSAIVVAAGVYVVIARLADRDQFDANRWDFYSQWAVMRFLLGGLVNTLKAAGAAMVLAVVVGGAMALGRLSRNRPLRWAAGTYVELFRSLPLLVMIFFAYLGMPTILDDFGIELSRFTYLVLALTAYNSAVLAEIFRAGVLSLDRGQTEAAQALGLSYRHSMVSVVLPQAIRRMVPAIVSQLVTLLKDTALGFIIGYEELLRRGQIAGENTSPKTILQGVFIVAVIYIAVNLALSLLARRLEVRQRSRYRAGEIRVQGVEELA